MASTIVILHGALGSAEQMAPIGELLDDELQVVVLELPGHGRTPASAPFSMSRFATHVRKEMDERGIERAHFFGYSMGGYVALLLAGDSPERVTSVATLGTKFHWTPEVAAKECRRLDAATISAKVPAFAAALEARHRSAGGWELMLERTSSLLRDLGRSVPLDGSALSSVTVPVLIMVGDGDTTVSAEECAAIRAQIPTAEVRVLPATPHPIEQVRPDLLAAELLAFVRGQPLGRHRVSKS